MTANEHSPFSKNNQSAWYKIKSPFGTEQYIPRIMDITAENLRQYSEKWRRRKCLLVLLILLLLLLIMAIVITAILLPILLARRNSSTTNSSPISTTTINCIYPYIITPSRTCVNILIDANNCGTVGNICPQNYSSCSAGVCSTAPGVQLQQAKAIWSSAINGSADDQMFLVTLPWNITLYNTTTNRVTVTTDGVLCLGGCSTAYTETRLPTPIFSGATAFPYWDDLYIYANTSQGIYYASEGNAPNRTLIFEYYMSHYLEPNQYYHFQVLFFESISGVVQYKYFDASDGGITCTIGVQASSSGPFIQYAFDQVNLVRTNMTLTFNTNLGTYTNSTIG